MSETTQAQECECAKTKQPCDKHGQPLAPQAQDYGEPWRSEMLTDGTVFICTVSESEFEDRRYEGEEFVNNLNKKYKATMGPKVFRSEKRAARAVSCVNALRGIADPEAFVKAADALCSVVARQFECDGIGGARHFSAADEWEAYCAARGKP